MASQNLYLNSSSASEAVIRGGRESPFLASHRLSACRLRYVRRMIFMCLVDRNGKDYWHGEAFEFCPYSTPCRPLGAYHLAVCIISSRRPYYASPLDEAGLSALFLFLHIVLRRGTRALETEPATERTSRRLCFVRFQRDTQTGGGG